MAMTKQEIIDQIALLAQNGALDNDGMILLGSDEEEDGFGSEAAKKSMRDPSLWEIVWGTTPDRYEADGGIPWPKDYVDPNTVERVWHGMCDVENFDSRLVIEFHEMKDGTLVAFENVGD